MQNNKKTLIIVVVIILLILLGLVGYGISSKSSGGQKQMALNNSAQEKTAEKQQDVNTATEPTETTVTGSLFDLIKMGNVAKCTFSTKGTDNASATGMTYISGKNVRGDFTIVSSGNTIQSHMISDGEWVYTWTSALPQGFKMKVDPTETAKLQEEASKVKGMENFQDKYEYRCSNWSEDTALFEIPSNIQFADFTDTIKNLNIGGNSACSACDLIPDAEAKAECKTRLSCN